MVKSFLLLVVLNGLLTAGLAQSFLVGNKQQTFTDPSRSNRNITTEIYYPANTTGSNVPVAAGQFPVLVFGHGFVMTWSAYDVVWNNLVPNGYIVVFPTTETSLSPSHTDFGKDIAFLVGAMKAEGMHLLSTFFGSVAATSAVMGHSMGGGAAFLAVQYDSSITALATLAAAVTNPSSVTAATSISIPSIVISGANDCVTPPAQHQIPMYDSLNSNCKTLVSITGASHCQFASYNLFCYIGEGTCSPPPALSPAIQQATTFSLLLPWLDFYLKNDCQAGTMFQSLISAGAGITSQQNCALLCTRDEEIMDAGGISLFPNPFTSSTTLTSEKHVTDVSLTIYNYTGQCVKRVNNLNGKTIRIERHNLPGGIYFIQLKAAGKTIYTGKVLLSE